MTIARRLPSCVTLSAPFHGAPLRLRRVRLRMLCYGWQRAGREMSDHTLVDLLFARSQLASHPR
jgi:hypothetical protein